MDVGPVQVPIRKKSAPAGQTGARKKVNRCALPILAALIRPRVAGFDPPGDTFGRTRFPDVDNPRWRIRPMHAAESNNMPLVRPPKVRLRPNRGPGFAAAPFGPWTDWEIQQEIATIPPTHQARSGLIPTAERKVDTGDLIRRAQAGDQTALGELLDVHRDELLRWANQALSRRIKARVDASDLVQQNLLVGLQANRRILRPRSRPVCRVAAASARPEHQERRARSGADAERHIAQ
jgi:hypothetical protein